MKKSASLGTVGLIVMVFQSFPAAGQEGFAGEWMLSIDQGRGPMTGHLELVQDGGGFIGHVEGGPVTVSVEGNRVELGVDDRTGAGERYVRTLTGELDGDVMEGRFGPEEPSQFCRSFPLSCDDPTGTWQAERIVDTPPGEQAPRPVDFSGIWVTAPGGGGIARYTMDLTPAAQAWVDEFDTELDLPSQRCVSSGLFRRFTSSIEIMRGDSHFTLLYSVGEARRIYTDGRTPPESRFPTPLGYSIGTWEGSTLVVRTTHLQPTVRGYRGEPISENAHFEERYTLSEDGMTLSGVLVLHDPENYRKPPMRRRVWRRDPQAEFTLVSCDPDSFFRQLYEDGKMEQYIDRSDRRL